MRPDKHHYYLEVARATSMRSTCLKNQCGAVIVKDDVIVSTGYNGAPRGVKNCIDIGECYRITHNIPSGTHYEACASLHGECNAIIAADRSKMLHGTMYLYQYDLLNKCVRKNPGSCQMCRRMIINAGISKVIFADPDGMHFDPELGYGLRIAKVEDWVVDGIETPIG